MKSKITKITFLFVLLNSYCVGQMEIQIGQKFPNVEVVFYKNDKKFQLEFKSMNGKGILIDFWGINCISCIEGLLHLKEFQDRFKDKFQIFVVTSDKRESVLELFKGLSKSLRGSQIVAAAKNLSFVFDDTLFSKLIPYKHIPLHAWIDTDMKFQGLAYIGTTTNENIEALLEKKTVQLALYKLPPPKFDESKPETWPSIGESFFRYANCYSFFCNYIEKGPRATYLNQVFDTVSGRIMSISILNKSIFDLCKVAFFNGRDVPDDSLFVSVPDSMDYFMPVIPEEYYKWRDKNMYCYAVKMDSLANGDLFLKMRQDLDSYFGLYGNYQQELVSCWEITMDPNVNFDSRERRPFSRMVDSLNRSLTAYSYTTMDDAKELIKKLIQAHFDNRLSSVVDETGHRGRIDIILPSFVNAYDIPIDFLAKLLRSQGLILKETKRHQNRFVLMSRKQ